MKKRKPQSYISIFNSLSKDSYLKWSDIKASLRTKATFSKDWQANYQKILRKTSENGCYEGLLSKPEYAEPASLPKRAISEKKNYFSYSETSFIMP